MVDTKAENVTMDDHSESKSMGGDARMTDSDNRSTCASTQAA